MSATLSNYTIHQTLHGYSHGHRLIASSREIPREIERAMLVLSDISGPTPREEFADYISGYPIDHLKCYVFARTWYAFEMPRPGCVWTHSLLIPFEVLEVEEIVGALERRFRRPSGPDDDMTSYRQQVRLDKVALDRPDPSVVPLGQIRNVLQGMYRFPASCVIWPSSGSHDAGVWAMRMWSQQFAQLRARFSFCTGALSARYINERPFDLHIVPVNDTRLVTRALNDVYLADNANDIERQQWIDELMGGMLSPLHPLNRWIAEYAADMPAERGTMAAIAEAYTVCGRLATDQAYPRRIISLLSRQFPNVRVAKDLKRYLLSSDGPWLMGSRDHREFELLLALAESKIERALDPTDLRLRERAAQMWRVSPTGASRLLTTAMGNRRTSLADSIMVGLAASIPVREARKLADAELDLFLAIVLMREELVTRHNVWPSDCRSRLAVADVLLRADSDARERSKLIQAMFRLQDNCFVDGLFAAQGDRVTIDMLELQNNFVRQRGVVPTRWLRAASGHDALIVDWLASAEDLSPAACIVACEVLDVKSDAVKSGPAAVWYAIVRGYDIKSFNKIDGEDGVGVVNAFLLSVGLSVGENEYAALVVDRFELIYGSLREGKLTESAWRKVEQSLLGTHDSNVERARALREGLIWRFIEAQWDPQSLMASMRVVETLEDVVDTIERKYGRQTVRRLADYVAVNRTEFAEWQADLLLSRGRRRSGWWPFDL